MSIVADQIRRLDAQLDRVHLLPRAILTSQSQRIASSTRIQHLQDIVKQLSTSSTSSALLSPWRVGLLLERAEFEDVVQREEDADGHAQDYGLRIDGEGDGWEDRNVETEDDLEVKAFERELEWLLVGKATVQVYGALLNTLLDGTIPLSEDIWYWDQVLGSYTWMSLYTIQTAPVRFLSWAKEIYGDTKRRLERVRRGSEGAIDVRGIGMGLGEQWRQFYGLVRESVRERSLGDIQRRVMGPIALCRDEAKLNQARLRRLREMGASGLGVLMDEGLSFDVRDDTAELTSKTEDDGQEWKVVVERSVALMDTVLRNVTTLESGVSDFEDHVFASVEDDPEIFGRDIDTTETARPAKIAGRLQRILNVRVPNHITASRRLASDYGRPSRLVRYWLPASVLLLSSTTILRIFVNRKADIIAWIRDLGVTVQDFWFNWIIEPTKRIIATIRHDTDSEVAIMSKESLRGDRDSLERMVVDFAIDNSQASAGEAALSEAQISDIRAKVKEGDLTPVLRAYEKDLRKPLQGAIRGDLVRTLLIQVQKTKVDVEVAISGIDALLRSQELVFGFVGLTPGVLVCFAAFRYFGGVFGNRRGLRQGRKAGETVRVLRNIDRILAVATPTPSNLLSYKDHGLLLCEVHVLRKRARKLFPGEIEMEFLEDVNDLCNINIGIAAQLKVLERIRWGYAKWLR